MVEIALILYMKFCFLLLTFSAGIEIIMIKHKPRNRTQILFNLQLNDVPTVSLGEDRISTS